MWKCVLSQENVVNFLSEVRYPQSKYHFGYHLKWYAMDSLCDN